LPMKVIRKSLMECLRDPHRKDVHEITQGIGQSQFAGKFSEISVTPAAVKNPNMEYVLVPLPRFLPADKEKIKWELESLVEKLSRVYPDKT
jgi:hypothetical protein